MQEAGKVHPARVSPRAPGAGRRRASGACRSPPAPGPARWRRRAGRYARPRPPPFRGEPGGARRCPGRAPRRAAPRSRTDRSAAPSRMAATAPMLCSPKRINPSRTSPARGRRSMERGARKAAASGGTVTVSCPLPVRAATNAGNFASATPMRGPGRGGWPRATRARARPRRRAAARGRRAHVGRARLRPLHPIAHPLQGGERLPEHASVGGLVRLQHRCLRMPRKRLLQRHSRHHSGVSGKVSATSGFPAERSTITAGEPRRWGCRLSSTLALRWLMSTQATRTAFPR